MASINVTTGNKVISRHTQEVWRILQKVIDLEKIYYDSPSFSWTAPRRAKPVRQSTFLPVTLPHVYYLKKFYQQTCQQMCSELIIENPTTPPMCSYTTLWSQWLFQIVAHFQQDSVATCLKCDENFNYHSTAKLQMNLAMDEFWKSVKNWQRCCHDFGVVLFWTRCTSLIVKLVSTPYPKKMPLYFW